MRSKIDEEKFVRVWQGAANTKQVCQEMGLTAIQAASKATNLRKAGIELKGMGRVKRDRSSLIALAKSLAPVPGYNEATPKPAASVVPAASTAAARPPSKPAAKPNPAKK